MHVVPEGMPPAALSHPQHPVNDPCYVPSVQELR